MARPVGTLKNDVSARRLWGLAYEEIPKSVFAAIAWHLANAASGQCDIQGAAERRFLEEWSALERHGLLAPTAAALKALQAAAPEREEARLP